MPGVRIQHRIGRNGYYVLSDSGQPLQGRQDPCPICSGVVHDFKTWHLLLDDQGAVIVSTQIAERIKQMGPAMTGFEIVSEVLNPPPQRIGIGGPAGPLAPILSIDN